MPGSSVPTTYLIGLVIPRGMLAFVFFFKVEKFIKLVDLASRETLPIAVGQNLEQRTFINQLLVVSEKN